MIALQGCLTFAHYYGNSEIFRKSFKSLIIDKTEHFIPILRGTNINVDNAHTSVQKDN